MYYFGPFEFPLLHTASFEKLGRSLRTGPGNKSRGKGDETRGQSERPGNGSGDETWEKVWG